MNKDLVNSLQGIHQHRHTHTRSHLHHTHASHSIYSTVTHCDSVVRWSDDAGANFACNVTTSPTHVSAAATRHHASFILCECARLPVEWRDVMHDDVCVLGMICVEDVVSYLLKIRGDTAFTSPYVRYTAQFVLTFSLDSTGQTGAGHKEVDHVVINYAPFTDAAEGNTKHVDRGTHETHDIYTQPHRCTSTYAATVFHFIPALCVLFVMYLHSPFVIVVLVIASSPFSVPLSCTHSHE